MMKRTKRGFFVVAIAFLFVFPGAVLADSLGQKETFFVDKEYDAQGREELSSTLQKITDSFYVYVDDVWWNSASLRDRVEILGAAGNLSTSLEEEIRPKISPLFGRENTPGIDGDERLTLLIHGLNGNLGAYVRTGDAYSVFESPRSNEREMLYFAPDRILDSRAPSFLAHEYMHLVTLNRRELEMGITDDVWMQEAFSEIAPAIVGYDQDGGGYLDQRVRDFIRDPRNSLPEWWGLSQDYGVVSMFMYYLRDRYGEELLRDAFLSSASGIEAFEEALSLGGVSKNFADVFEEWTLALFLNDCSYGDAYCYEHEGLQGLRVTPYTNFLPLVGESELTVTNQSKAWAGNWHKVSGGNGELKIDFQGTPSAVFRVPYLVQKNTGAYEIGRISLSRSNAGSVTVPNFGTDALSFILIPLVEGKKSGFEGSQPSFIFTWISTIRDLQKEQEEAGRIQELLAIIEDLKAQIARIKAEASPGGGNVSCSRLSSNLGFGEAGSANVRCLQEFLAAQGPDIYPEKLITGNYFSLTRQAVIRFQERYAEEILTPLGLSRGTGYAGTATRAQINKLLALRN